MASGEEETPLEKSDVYGEYEIITIKDNYKEKDLGGTGQSNTLLEEEINKSLKLTLNQDNVKDFNDGVFTLKNIASEISGDFAFYRY